jgi:hypothetical protein
VTRNGGPYEAVQKAKAKAKAHGVTDLQGAAYINALAVRYSIAPDADRAALDAAYAESMRQLHRHDPADAGAVTMFAEALIDMRPWDYWSMTGSRNRHHGDRRYARGGAPAESGTPAASK